MTKHSNLINIRKNHNLTNNTQKTLFGPNHLLKDNRISTSDHKYKKFYLYQRDEIFYLITTLNFAEKFKENFMRQNQKMWYNYKSEDERYKPDKQMLSTHENPDF